MSTQSVDPILLSAERAMRESMEALDLLKEGSISLPEAESRANLLGKHNKAMDVAAKREQFIFEKEKQISNRKDKGKAAATA